MGRLTTRNIFNKARCKKNGTKLCYDADECMYCKFNQEILEKLAHYEDMEEAGRLIELPCEKWSSLYHVCWINKKYVVEPLTVVGFSGNDKDDLVIKVFRMYYDLAEMEFSVGAIGVSIFTTEEEAEAKLQEVDNEHVLDKQ